MTASAPNALRPWLIVAVALPLLALGAWALGLFDSPPEAPIADRNLRELEHNLAPPAADVAPKGRTPRVIFLGDSRYLRAIRDLSVRVDPRTPIVVESTAGPMEVMTFFGRAGSTLDKMDRYVDDIFAWKPDAVVLQPELLVEETSFRGLAPPALSAEGRRKGWQTRIDRWADKVEPPRGGKALAALERFVARAKAAGVHVIAAQLPPSQRIHDRVPADYYEVMRRLVCSALEDCERDYLRFAEVYPDTLFRDPLHLNREGRARLYPELMAAVARAIARGER